MNAKLAEGLKDWRVWVVTVYIFFAFIWSMPNDRIPYKPALDRIARPAFLFLGLWQGWDMFSPNPRREDIYVEVFYRNRDGSTKRYALTKMIDMPLFARWQKERWRKYFNDNLRVDSSNILWVPFAEYTRRQLVEQGEDPVEIHLIRKWRDSIIPVAPEHRADVSQRPWESYTFFRWTVPDPAPPRLDTGGSL